VEEVNATEEAIYRSSIGWNSISNRPVVTRAGRLDSITNGARNIAGEMS